MAQDKLNAEIAQAMERRDKELRAASAQEIILDKTNKVSFPGFPYTFEALGERILVSIDVFKSGYECKVCGGTGRIKHECECVTCGHSGKKYSAERIEEIRKDLGDSVAESRVAMVCPECGGDPASVARDVECDACHGRGAILVLPEESKNLPTTGVVVSMGSIAQEKASYTIGDRVLFGAYAGQMIPTKVGLMFKYMDWNLAALKIEGAENMAAFDFILNVEE
jgi:hypothetical protein